MPTSGWTSEAHPLLGQLREIRNREWYHMVNDHVISMPDKWEYPWYAAWDLAFHCIALAAVDPDFAREQLDLMLREIYMHASGQIPAYEWNFSDVNPPEHAWATLFLHRFALEGEADLNFLKQSFLKLALNFNWWVNRKDRTGKNVFEGGFLGLDNIGVFDRSSALPTGGYLNQADGTAWMAFFCQNMIELSVELAAEDHAYTDMCTKFVEHFGWIASGMNRTGPSGMSDEEDGFYYDVLRLPDGSAQRLARIFLRDATGRRAVFGGAEKFQNDPHWRDYILFYEYFHGDTGAGLGASHQTGWTGMVARLIQLFGLVDAKQYLEGGSRSLRKALKDGAPATPASDSRGRKKAVQVLPLGLPRLDLAQDRSKV